MIRAWRAAVVGGTLATSRRTACALRRLLVRHWVLVVLLLGGIGLRVVTQLAYRPALLYIDSERYLHQLASLDPTGLDPVGYTAYVLEPILAVAGLAAVVAVQHLTALCMAVAIYVLLVRWGVWRWLAALATAPVLLDAYQLQIEQTIMTDEPFQVLLVALLVLLGWRRVPPLWSAPVAGILCAAAATVRLVGVTLVVPVMLYLVLAPCAVRGGRLARQGWRNWRQRGAWLTRLGRVGLVVLTAGCGVFGYAAYFHSWSGEWALSTTSGTGMYGRVATVADCEALELPVPARQLCPAAPPGERTGPEYFMHGRRSPLAGLYERLPPKQVARAVSRFNHAVLVNQPFDVAGSVLADFVKGFRWSKANAKGDPPVERWQFQTDYPQYGPGDPQTALLREAGYQGPEVDHALAGFLRAYQLGGGYMPGTLLGVCLLLGLAGAATSRRRRPELRIVALLPVLLTVTVLGTAALLEFSWRYQLPALALAPAAAALGITAWRKQGRPPVTGQDAYPG